MTQISSAKARRPKRIGPSPLAQFHDPNLVAQAPCPAAQCPRLISLAQWPVPIRSRPSSFRSLVFGLLSSCHPLAHCLLGSPLVPHIAFIVCWFPRSCPGYCSGCPGPPARAKYYVHSLLGSPFVPKIRSLLCWAPPLAPPIGSLCVDFPARAQYCRHSILVPPLAPKIAFVVCCSPPLAPKVSSLLCCALPFVPKTAFRVCTHEPSAFKNELIRKA